MPDDRTVREVLTRLKKGLVELYGDRLCKVVLFGSRARGDNDPDSDIDVLVVLKPPVRVGEEIARTSHLVAELCLDSDVVLSRVFVGLDRFDGQKGPLMRNVRREGLPV